MSGDFLWILKSPANSKISEVKYYNFKKILHKDAEHDNFVTVVYVHHVHAGYAVENHITGVL